MNGTGCVICTSKPREASHGYLCGGHFQRLAETLRSIEDEAAIMSAVPSFQQNTGNGSGTPAFTRAPVRLNVLVHNDPRSRQAGTRPPGPACPSCWHDTCTDIRAWLDAYDAQATDILAVLDVIGSWARVVRDERKLTAEGRATVTTERAVLTRHLDWVAEQPWCDEMYGDVRTLLAQLRQVNGTGSDKPYCDCPVINGTQPCPGSVWVHDEPQPVWRRYPDRCSQTWEQAPGAAVCDSCGSTWTTESDKARLKRMVADAAAEKIRPHTGDGRPMLTAQELVDRGYAPSLVAVRVYAHRRGTVAVHGHYDPVLFDKATA